MELYNNLNESSLIDTFLMKLASLKIFKKYDKYISNKDAEDYSIRRCIVNDYIKTLNPKVDITDSYRNILSEESILVTLGDSYKDWYEPEQYDYRGVILLRKKYINYKTRPADSVLGVVIERCEKIIPDSYISWKKKRTNNIHGRSKKYSTIWLGFIHGVWSFNNTFMWIYNNRYH